MSYINCSELHEVVRYMKKLYEGVMKELHTLYVQKGYAFICKSSKEFKFVFSEFEDLCYYVQKHILGL